MTLEKLRLDDPLWCSFVAGSRDATPFHLPVWAGLLAETYGYRAFALALRDGDGTLLAGAPMIATTRIGLRGGRAISLPFTDECPLLARDPAPGPVFVDGVQVASEGVGLGCG